jgi:hypothetical protein
MYVVSVMCAVLIWSASLFNINIITNVCQCMIEWYNE